MFSKVAETFKECQGLTHSPTFKVQFVAPIKQRAAEPSENNE
jgi:hypothetical protein